MQVRRYDLTFDLLAIYFDVVILRPFFPHSLESLNCDVAHNGHLFLMVNLDDQRTFWRHGALIYLTLPWVYWLSLFHFHSFPLHFGFLFPFYTLSYSLPFFFPCLLFSSFLSAFLLFLIKCGWYLCLGCSIQKLPFSTLKIIKYWQVHIANPILSYNSLLPLTLSCSFSFPLALSPPSWFCSLFSCSSKHICTT